MSLFSPIKLKKQIQSNKRKKNYKKRVIEQSNPDVGAGLKYTSQFEEGLMHIVGNEYSQMYELGELDYEVSSEDDQLNIVMGYAEGLNNLDQKSGYQLLVINQPVPKDLLENTLLPYQGDKLDNYRQEINQTIESHYKRDQRNFETKKYAIFSTEGRQQNQANHTLKGIARNFDTRYKAYGIDLELTPQTGLDRLAIFSKLLRPNGYFSATYEDIAISGLSSKAFVAPSRLGYPRNKDYIRIGDDYAAVLYIRHYPRYLEDVLIRELCAESIELAISIHARPYNMSEVKKNLQATRTLNNASIEKRQKQNFQSGIIDSDAVSGEAGEIRRATEGLKEEIQENGQKIFSGIFSVYVTGKTLEELEYAIKAVKDVGETWQVTFETVVDHKEEALNTILPIGKPYLDVEYDYMRDMTTSNLATQIPFSNIELQSPTGQFYGRNQRTNNMITIDRKMDLITPSGMIFGTSGSGKGMATKWEIFSTRLKYPNDRTIIVDPESEYLAMAKEFGAEILDISSGTSNHLNILDMANVANLDNEDRRIDLVKEKVNLLSDLFDSLLKDYSDVEAGIVDRVTRALYQKFDGSDETPTLVDWHELLSEEPDDVSQAFLLKVTPYTVGAQDIFAHKTNVDLSANFVVFNIKNLDERLKPFAMRVILDQIWNQVVAGQKKVTTHLYFDELQLNFQTESSANWFMELWSRIRKYGAIPTGITQNVATLLDSSAGRKMISNSEFILLLRQKPVDLDRLKEMINLSPKLISYISDRVPQGTGLVSAGGVVVPFENPIPENTELFNIMNTDA